MNLFLKYTTPNKNKIGEYLVFPIPQNSNNQLREKLEIKSSLKFKLFNEPKYKNEFIVFKLSKNRDKLQINTKVKLLKTKNNIKKNNFKPYFVKDRFINYQDKKIKNLSQKIILKEKKPYQQIKKIYDFTVNNLTYDKPIKGLYSYKQAIEVLEGKRSGVDCGGFSTLLISLLQSQNIPARLVVGYLKNKSFLSKIFLTFNLLTMHAWVEALLPNNTYLSLDPSIEWRRKKGLTKRKGGFGEIPNDRIIFSYGQDFSINLKNKNYNINILQHPIII